jgi:hypothetical protein
MKSPTSAWLRQNAGRRLNGREAAKFDLPPTTKWLLPDELAQSRRMQIPFLLYCDNCLFYGAIPSEATAWSRGSAG